ncbi:MAG: hypothetical protein RQ756_01040 [Flavobacteriaceae bacterium]|nr:hypothetical protein [Flavobacteriaceae bacterium]
MMLYFRGINVFLWIVLLSAISWGQEKREVEKRISEAALNAQAFECFKTLSIQKRIKRKRWYLQTKAQDSVYELKFKYLKQKYSIEFYMGGTPKNVEVEYTKNNLEPAVLARIKTALSSRFDKFKLRKIQKGFEQLEQISCDQLLLTNLLDNQAAVYYEIVILGITPNDKALYEVNFDASGSFIHLHKIILQSTDILDY